MGPVSVWLLALLGFFINLEKNRKEVFVLLIWYLFPIMVQAEFAKVFTARYILSSLPFLFILAASSFRGLSFRRVKSIFFSFDVSALPSLPPLSSAPEPSPAAALPSSGTARPLRARPGRSSPAQSGGGRIPGAPSRARENAA